MNHQHLLRTVALTACVGWLASCTSVQDADALQKSYWRHLAAELQHAKQPRERALAAQLLGIGATDSPASSAPATGQSARDAATTDSIRALVAESAQSDDAVALSLAIQASNEIGDGNARSGAARRWQAVEPDNLAPRLFTDMPVDALLASVRDTTRYDTHAYEQIRLMQSVFKRWPMGGQGADPGHPRAVSDSEQQAVVDAFSIWAAFGIPAFQELTVACKGEALRSTPTRRGDCLHAARVLSASSDNLLSMGIGIGMLERAADTPEDIALAARLRSEKEWQQHQYYVVLARGMDERQQASDMVRLLAMPGVGNEIQLMRAGLREKGIALVPPVGWQPSKND